MTEDEWTDIVAKEINAGWPGQQIEPMTGAVWFQDLQTYPADRVRRAIGRCRRASRWRPEVAEILDAMLANAQERAAEPSNHRAIEARNPDSPGVPPPADYKAARERFLNTTRIPDDPQPSGRSRAQQLAELEAETEAVAP